MKTATVVRPKSPVPRPNRRSRGPKRNRCQSPERSSYLWGFIIHDVSRVRRRSGSRCGAGNRYSGQRSDQEDRNKPDCCVRTDLLALYILPLPRLRPQAQEAPSTPVATNFPNAKPYLSHVSGVVLNYDTVCCMSASTATLAAASLWTWVAATGTYCSWTSAHDRSLQPEAEDVGSPMGTATLLASPTQPFATLLPVLIQTSRAHLLRRSPTDPTGHGGNARTDEEEPMTDTSPDGPTTPAAGVLPTTSGSDR